MGASLKVLNRCNSEKVKLLLYRHKTGKGVFHRKKLPISFNQFNLIFSEIETVLKIESQLIYNEMLLKPRWR